MTTDDPPSAKRRGFQFSIRTMLIAILAVAFMLGAVRDYGLKLMWRMCRSLEFFGQSCPEGISDAEFLEMIRPIEEE